MALRMAGKEERESERREEKGREEDDRDIFSDR